ncbi:unnamed protein product, partial [Oppiella nova]
MALKGDFAELMDQFTTSVVDDDSDSNHSSEGPIRARASTSEPPAQTTDSTVDKSKLVEIETTGSGNVKFAIYKKFAKSMSMFWTFSILIGYAITNGCNSGSSFWITYWTDDPNGTERNGYYLGIYAVIGFCQAASLWYGWSSIVSGSLLASRTLHQKLLSNIIHAPMHFFDTTPMGRVINRFSKDIDVLDSIMQMTLRVLCSTVFQTLAILATISIQTPIFIAVFVPVMVIYYLIQKFYVTTS